MKAFRCLLKSFRRHSIKAPEHLVEKDQMKQSFGAKWPNVLDHHLTTMTSCVIVIVIPKHQEISLHLVIFCQSGPSFAAFGKANSGFDRATNMELHFPRNWLEPDQTLEHQFDLAFFRAWKCRHLMDVPLEIESAATDEEKANTIKEIEAFSEGLRTKCARLVEKLFTECGAEELHLKRADGQSVSDWKETKSAINVIRKTKGEENIGNEMAHNLKCKSLERGWQHEQETVVMLDLNMSHRLTPANQKMVLGFVSRFLSHCANRKRKETVGMKRRQKAEVDERGTKKRRKNTHKQEFDPEKHVDLTETPKKKNG